jgi:hypothetical protein
VHPQAVSAKPARLARHRNGNRTTRYRGEAVTIEMRDGRVIPATIIDESPLGLALTVSDFSPFAKTQHIAVRRRGQRLTAVVRNVHADDPHRRMGLGLLSR